MSSCISDKVIRKKSGIQGYGLYAYTKINKGEIVTDFSKTKGSFVTEEEGDEMDLWNNGKFDYILQVGEKLYWVASLGSKIDPCFSFNHSCNPNCGMNGRFKMVAMRDIVKGEELTFDYAMTESSDFKIKCLCGSDLCRKIITGNDWRSEALQNKYFRYFSPYLAKKIDVYTKKR